MCFNVAAAATKAEMEAAFQAEWEGDGLWIPSEELFAFDYPQVPVLYLHKGNRRLSLFQWGLLPPWVKTDTRKKDIRRYTLNARWETLDQKPSFRDSVNRRCILPSTAFYEFKQSEGQKIRYRLQNQSGAWLPLAGLYSSGTFTIVTIPARGIMREIHNTKFRMPLMLDEAEIERWLNPKISLELLDLSLDCPTLRAEINKKPQINKTLQFPLWGE